MAAGPAGPRAVGAAAVGAAQARAVARANAAAAEAAGGAFQGQPLREAVVRHQAGDGARAGAAVGTAVGGLPVAAAVAGAVVLPQLGLRQTAGLSTVRGDRTAGGSSWLGRDSGMIMSSDTLGSKRSMRWQCQLSIIARATGYGTQAGARTIMHALFCDRQGHVKQQDHLKFTKTFQVDVDRCEAGYMERFQSAGALRSCSPSGLQRG